MATEVQGTDSGLGQGVGGGRRELCSRESTEVLLIGPQRGQEGGGFTRRHSSEGAVGGQGCWRNTCFSSISEDPPPAKLQRTVSHEQRARELHGKGVHKAPGGWVGAG